MAVVAQPGVVAHSMDLATFYPIDL